MRRDKDQWLFLDLNAFFASCEQQENPALRGHPVIVVQTLTESAVAIAASYAAKGCCQVNLSRSEKPKQDARSHCGHRTPPFARRLSSKDPQR